MLTTSAQNVFDTAGRVRDAFDLRASYGLEQGPGVVLVLESFRVDDPRSLVGRSVTIRTPLGPSREVLVDDARDHGETVSLFFKNLSRVDLPAGSVVEFSG
ncbi:MAG TPA: hypothetical protein VFT74_15620 [Isosphaeraceae bacterium]|nr:hypothetical protein [Isosphaeraceae bacterium]